MPSLSTYVVALALSSPSLAGLLKRQNAPSAPTADVRNGTIVGRYAPEYDQDYFLGIPYAQPPTGDLRFRPPEPLNESWTGTHNATEYSPQCIGYGMDTWSQGNYVSEDCLTLNVIRSTGSGQGLPVVFWIHGGGFFNGGSSDNRYNQSFIVQQAALAGNPIIAVSVNYRLAEWGFLYGQAVQDSGNTVLGFRDQRLALQWVQENIEAFGGDPRCVTIQGESAGGTSIAALLLAYGGRDDGLFAGAIAESGPPARVTPSVS